MFYLITIKTKDLEKKVRKIYPRNHCLKCKKTFRLKRNCKCDSDSITDEQLIIEYHRVGDSSYDFTKKVNGLGFVGGQSTFAKKMKNLGIDTNPRNRGCLPDGFIDYLNTLEKRPNKKKTKEIANLFDVCHSVMHRELTKLFGLKTKKKVDNDKPSVVDMNIMKNEHLPIYNKWLKNKTIPIPLEIVIIAPNLKKHGLIK